MQPAPAQSADRPSVIVTTSTFPIHADDGMPRFVCDLATALSAHLQVKVLAPDAPQITLTPAAQLDVERFSYFWPRSLRRLAYGGGMIDNMRSSLLARMQTLPFLVAEAMALRRMVRRETPSYVNSHWLVPQGWTAAWVRGRRPRFHHVLQVHAGDVYLLQRLPFGGPLARWVVARPDAIFAAGSHVRDALDDLLGYASGAVLRPMGIDTASFREPRPLPKDVPSYPAGYLAFVGRFVEKKGVAYLLRALASVRSRHDVGLVLVGYGPLEDKLRQEARSAGVADQVHFAGRRSHQEVVAILQGCSTAIVPSIVDRHGETEGMPTVVTEAMAAGAKVVASAVDGIPDVLRHEVNGWLCRPKDPTDLAEKIGAALDEDDDSPLVREARATAELHDWKEVAATYWRCFEALPATRDDPSR